MTRLAPSSVPARGLFGEKLIGTEPAKSNAELILSALKDAQRAWERAEARRSLRRHDDETLIDLELATIDAGKLLAATLRRAGIDPDMIGRVL